MFIKQQLVKSIYVFIQNIMKSQIDFFIIQTKSDFS